MVRKKTESFSLRCPVELAKRIDQMALELNTTRNGILIDLLKTAFKTNSDFCVMKAKEAAQDLHYWKGRAEAMESDPGLFYNQFGLGSSNREIKEDKIFFSCPICDKYYKTKKEANNCCKEET